MKKKTTYTLKNEQNKRKKENGKYKKNKNKSTQLDIFLNFSMDQIHLSLFHEILSSMHSIKQNKTKQESSSTSTTTRENEKKTK